MLVSVHAQAGILLKVLLIVRAATPGKIGGFKTVVKNFPTKFTIHGQSLVAELDPRCSIRLVFVACCICAYFSAGVIADETPQLTIGAPIAWH